MGSVVVTMMARLGICSDMVSMLQHSWPCSTHRLAQSAQSRDERPPGFPELVEGVQHQHKLPPPLQQLLQIHTQRTQVLGPRIRPSVDRLIVGFLQRIERRCYDALKEMSCGDAFAHAEDGVRDLRKVEVCPQDRRLAGRCQAVDVGQGW